MSHASDRDRRILGAFAELLGYPGPATAQRALAAAREVAAASPRAAERLRRFARGCQEIPRGQLEELYTAAFDLAPSCVPYVGHHLFGEGRERAMFLARLREMQRAEGVVPGSDLPDHVCEVLRFLASAHDGEERDALLSDGLAPAAEKMLAALAQARHPWEDVLAALGEVVLAPQVTASSAAARPEVMP